LKNPNTNNLESYDLTLEFPEAVEWRHDLLGGEQEVDHYSFVYRGSDAWSFKLRIEYTDYVTAVALQSMIVNWYLTLDGEGREWSMRPRRYFEKILHHSNYSVFSMGNFIVRWFPLIISLSTSAVLFRALNNYFADINTIILTGFVFILLIALFDLIIRIFIQNTEKSLASSSRAPILLLNAGNRKIYDAERESIIGGAEKRKQRGKLLFGGILLSMLVSICANIITSLVW
jgi:hypothetical protein